MNPYLHRHYRQWIAGHGRVGRPVRCLLRVASWIYGLGVVGRLGLYRSGLLRRIRLSAPLISVGNIAAGGTGKTPFVMLLAREMRDRGIRPAVVVRGYGGRREGGTLVVADGETIRLGYPEVGDEAVLLARKLPGVPILMSADRVRGSQIAIDQFGAQVILLDDGFQHLRIERDLDILLLDRENPFGYGYLLPRGLLREPVGGLGRADLLVITGTGDPGEPMGIPSRLRHPSAATRLHAVYTPTTLTNVRTGEPVSGEDLRGQAVVVFSGVGKPASFEQTLASLGIYPKNHLIFPDHHPYDASDLISIGRCMEEVGATVALTTEKDAVRLEKLLPTFPVHAVGVSLTISRGQAELKRVLDGLFP